MMTRILPCNFWLLSTRLASMKQINIKIRDCCVLKMYLNIVLKSVLLCGHDMCCVGHWVGKSGRPTQGGWDIGVRIVEIPSGLFIIESPNTKFGALVVGCSDKKGVQIFAIRETIF